MNLQDFEKKWLGKRVDQDGVFGYQCVDLIKQYALEVLGMKPGAWGNAIDYWTNTNHPLLSKYTRVKTQSPKRGDIVILNPTATNKYGHIGIATDSNTMLEQNGATGDGDGLGGDEVRYRTIPKSRIPGVLRPKFKEEEMVSAQGLAVIYRFLLGIPTTEHGKKYYLDKVTFDHAYHKVLGSSLYKKKVERLGKTKEVDLNQLPAAMRRALKK